MITQSPDKSPEPTFFGAGRSAIAVHVASVGAGTNETGGSSKGDKWFAYGNCPLVEGLRRPERSGGRRRPSTKGPPGFILNHEKNNWPNASPTPFSKTSSNSLTAGKSIARKLATTSRSVAPTFIDSAPPGCKAGLSSALSSPVATTGQIGHLRPVSSSKTLSPCKNLPTSNWPPLNCPSASVSSAIVNRSPLLSEPIFPASSASQNRGPKPAAAGNGPVSANSGSTIP